MRKPGLLALGVVVALLGLLFSLQGFGVISGSSMSNSTFWSIGGPVVLIAGLLLVRIGAAGRLR